MKEQAITNPFYIQIQREIDKLDRKVTIYNTIFYIIRITLILIAGAITIISAIKATKGAKNSELEILIWLGAITTGLTAFDALFQTDAKRNTYKTMLFEMRSLRSDLVYAHYLEKYKCESLALAFEKYKSIKAMGRDLIGSESK